MKNYIVKIEPTSPLGTPIESDTLFGHLCWALAYIDGDAKLTDFLLEFDTQPPIVISNAFLENWLPFPNLPPLTLAERDELGKFFKENIPAKKVDKYSAGLLFYRWLKDLSKQSLISIETFKTWQPCFNKFEIYKEILQEKAALGSSPKISNDKSGKEPGKEFVSHSIWHNAISRKSATVIEGKLFDKEVTFYRPGIRFNVFIKTSDYLSREKLQELFEFISRNGFGADKSTGNGRFDFEIEEGNPFIESEDRGFNSFMLISNTNSGILKQFKKGDVNYTTQTKFGKVGGLLSTNAKYSPYKKPVLLLNPGTVIKTTENVEYVGENFRDVYLIWDNEGSTIQKPEGIDIRHYGIGFPVKLRLK